MNGPALERSSLCRAAIKLRLHQLGLSSGFWLRNGARSWSLVPTNVTHVETALNGQQRRASSERTAGCISVLL